MASTVRFGPFPRLHFSNRPETVNRLFPQACVNLGSFPRPFTTHTFRPFTTHWPQNLRPFTTHLHVVRQVEDLQVVGATNPVDKTNRNTEENYHQDGLHKRAVSQPSGPERRIKGLGAGRCGRMRRLRSAVVGGTRSPRSNLKTRSAYISFDSFLYHPIASHPPRTDPTGILRS